MLNKQYSSIPSFLKEAGHIKFFIDEFEVWYFLPEMAQVLDVIYRLDIIYLPNTLSKGTADTNTSCERI